jgi:hypothetical protein
VTTTTTGALYLTYFGNPVWPGNALESASEPGGGEGLREANQKVSAWEQLA